MQTSHQPRDSSSTRGFSTVDPERQGVRATDPPRLPRSAAPRATGSAPAAAATQQHIPLRARPVPGQPRR